MIHAHRSFTMFLTCWVDGVGVIPRIRFRFVWSTTLSCCITLEAKSKEYIFTYLKGSAIGYNAEPWKVLPFLFFQSKIDASIISRTKYLYSLRFPISPQAKNTGQITSFRFLYSISYTKSLIQ